MNRGCQLRRGQISIVQVERHELVVIDEQKAQLNPYTCLTDASTAIKSPAANSTLTLNNRDLLMVRNC
jgi:hypothetical protein